MYLKFAVRNFRMPPEICPQCGAVVPPKAKACPGCGSDETTGWSEAAHAENLGLPDEEFSYDDFVQREFNGPKPVPHGLAWYWWLVAILLLAIFLWSWFR